MQTYKSRKDCDEVTWYKQEVLIGLEHYNTTLFIKNQFARSKSEEELFSKTFSNYADKDSLVQILDSIGNDSQRFASFLVFLFLNRDRQRSSVDTLDVYDIMRRFDSLKYRTAVFLSMWKFIKDKETYNWHNLLFMFNGNPEYSNRVNMMVTLPPFPGDTDFVRSDGCYGEACEIDLRANDRNEHSVWCKKHIDESLKMVTLPKNYLTSHKKSE